MQFSDIDHSVDSVDLLVDAFLDYSLSLSLLLLLSPMATGTICIFIPHILAIDNFMIISIIALAIPSWTS